MVIILGLILEAEERDGCSNVRGGEEENSTHIASLFQSLLLLLSLSLYDITSLPNANLVTNNEMGLGTK